MSVVCRFQRYPHCCVARRDSDLAATGRTPARWRNRNEAIRWRGSRSMADHAVTLAEQATERRRQAARARRLAGAINAEDIADELRHYADRLDSEAAELEARAAATRTGPS